jgi:glutamate/aspartate transport system substrate-binding protein
MNSTLKAVFLVPTGFIAVIAFFSASIHADTLSKIRTSGEFVLGHRESSTPFSFVSKEGQPAGYSVDLCLRIFEQVKTELKRPDLKVKFVPLKPADRIPAVKDGRVDVECGSTTNTVSRQKDVAFSYTTFVAGARLLVKKSSNFKSVQDLRGKRISVTGATTTEKLVRQLNGERNLGAEIVTAKENIDAFKLLESGTTVAMAGDDALLVGLVSKSATPEVYDFVGNFLSVEPYGILMRKDDAAFSNVASTALSKLFETGEIRKIYAKWFESGAFKLAMNQYMKENIRVPNNYGVQ